jgi:hypothetical protein
MESDNIEAIVKLAGKLKSVKTDLEAKISAIPHIKGERGDDGRDGKDGKKGDKGEKGADGRDGRDGLNGKDGSDGKDGENGQDGVSVVDATVDFDNRLLIKLSNGDEIDAGVIHDKETKSTVVVKQQSGGFSDSGGTSPTMTYTNDLLTRVDYADGSYSVMTYTDSVLTQMNTYTASSSIQKVFIYNNGLLVQVIQT